MNEKSFGVKDIIDVAGAVVTSGSHFTGDRVAPVDAPLDAVSDTPFGRVEVSHVGLNDDCVEGLASGTAVLARIGVHGAVGWHRSHPMHFSDYIDSDDSIDSKS